MATIAFTDATGAATLDTGKPAPANRFVNWTPMTRPMGEAAHRQSDGARTMIVLREQYGATFEVRFITDRVVGAVRPLAIADRLVAHLYRGGTCTVTTGDVNAAVYTCSLMPGMEPQLTMADPRLREFTLTLPLINVGSAVPMTCYYRS